MRKGYDQILENAEAEIQYVADSVEELLSLDETRKLWKSWFSLLGHYTNAVSAMRRATDCGPAKIWSDNLLSEQRSDPILQYAKQARDHTNHVFEGRREVSERHVTLGSVFRIDGDAVVAMQGNVTIGPDGSRHPLPDGVFRTQGGRYLDGTISPEHFHEHDHFLVISDIRTRSGVWKIPNPSTPAEHRASEIGKYIVNWLRSKLQEARSLPK